MDVTHAFDVSRLFSSQAKLKYPNFIPMPEKSEKYYRRSGISFQFLYQNHLWYPHVGVYRPLKPEPYMSILIYHDKRE